VATHLSERQDGRPVSQLWGGTFGLRTSMTLKVFSVPSATLHGTMTSRGEHYKGRRESASFMSSLMKGLPNLEIEVQSRHVSRRCHSARSHDPRYALGAGVVFRRRRDESSSRLRCVTFDADDRLGREKITTTGARC